MRGMYWVTKSGDVVMSTGPKTNRDTVPCERVSSGAFLGTRRIKMLRPATPAEVSDAKKDK